MQISFNVIRVLDVPIKRIYCQRDCRNSFESGINIINEIVKTVIWHGLDHETDQWFQPSAEEPKHPRGSIQPYYGECHPSIPVTSSVRNEILSAVAARRPRKVLPSKPSRRHNFLDLVED